MLWRIKAPIEKENHGDQVASLICRRFESIGKEPWRLTGVSVRVAGVNTMQKKFEAEGKIFEGKIFAV